MAERIRRLIPYAGFDPEEGMLLTRKEAPDMLRDAGVLVSYRRRKKSDLDRLRRKYRRYLNLLREGRHG